MPERSADTSAPSLAWSPLALIRRLLGLRIGIAGYLAISFLAVGVLAVAANLLVEQGISIVEVTRFEAVPAAPLGEQQSVALSSVVVPPTPQAPSSEIPALADVVERYADAVAVRVQTPSEESHARVDEALRDLRAEQAARERRNAPGQQAFTTALRRYEDAGRELVSLADERRTSIEAYAASLASIDSRLAASVDKGWRIFGRVLTRESVLQLRADHDAMERAFATLRATDAVDKEAAVAALVESESAFERKLTENARQLRRGESPEWLEGITAELEHSRLLRFAMVDGSRTLEDADLAFTQARAALKSIAQLADVAAPASVVSVPTPTSKPFVGPLEEAVADGVDAQPETRVARQETDEHKRLLVALLTGGVLIVVLLISVGTVHSIVVPIRRLLKGMNDLGKHGVHEPIPRGGIRQLDTLAQSFNDMAQELLAARRDALNQHVLLEQRVEERTRQLAELAECDPLTGLPNRRHLLALLNNVLERRKDKVVAVFFLDLDNFKNINDSMGHGFGDEVLKAVAERLRDTTAQGGFAARLGGDEFTVVLTGTENVEDVRQAGLALITAFQRTLLVANRDLLISVSVGASVCPDHEVTAEGLLKAADAALFRAKALGRNQLALFTSELLAEAAARFTTEQGLRRGIERGEFTLLFQPEIDAESLNPVLVEALIRWRLPDGRLATPSEFLPVAEQSGLIAEISDWVLRAAIQAVANWHKGEWPEARVAINVSARQLLDHRFVDKVQALLQEFDLPTRCIEIELTETILQTGPATLDTLHRLHAAGIATALDDFGSGYSSLASLEKLPFSRIKLDKSLIDSIATSARSAVIARAIIWLCHSLGLEVTAEGVERPEQLALLRGYRPIVLQGYLLGRPVPATDVVAELKRMKTDVPALLDVAGDHGAESVLSADPIDRGNIGSQLAERPSTGPLARTGTAKAQSNGSSSKTWSVVRKR